MAEGRYAGWEGEFDSPEEGEQAGGPITDPSRYGNDHNYDMRLKNWVWDEEEKVRVNKTSFLCYDASYVESRDPYYLDELIETIRDAHAAGMPVEVRVASAFDVQDEERIRMIHVNEEHRKRANLEERLKELEGADRG